ncbi:hypothetical protein OAK45_01105 [Verrucomicrobia bacterium]|nr:hypothetical protein [Verrucomicrobiota bacterium]
MRSVFNIVDGTLHYYANNYDSDVGWTRYREWQTVPYHQIGRGVVPWRINKKD